MFRLLNVILFRSFTVVFFLVRFLLPLQNDTILLCDHGLGYGDAVMREQQA